VRVALTIAGSDSGAGAGIQADLKTFAAHGVYGTCAVTAITAQNTTGVLDVEPLPADLVIAQIEAVVSDIGVHAAKTGMLANAAIVEAVAATIEEMEVPLLVVDPVMIATAGQPLLDEDARDAMVSSLWPLAAVVTPNIGEAEALTGVRIEREEDRHEAARRIVGLGAAAVFITGGHLHTTDVTDLLFDGHTFTEFRTVRVPGTHTHGTGCTFSAALAALLATGESLANAIPRVQQYIAGAIRHAPQLGGGNGPLNHFWRQAPAGGA
jgi:hydroxymethylpyrimidine/phosphomethylpyrimidine kinase